MRMRLSLPIMSATIGLLGCSTPPAQYHDVVQHPYELHATTETADLRGRSATEAAALAAQIAAARPNNGSTFEITADAETAHRLQKAIVGAGVRPADVRIVVAQQAATIVRTDLVASVAGCTGAPQPISGFGAIDDGYGRSNANSALLGCAVRRNIAAMIDDPRTLMTPEPMSPRDGARAADVYGNYAKGEPTSSKSVLPTQRTSNTGVDSQ